MKERAVLSFKDEPSIMTMVDEAVKRQPGVFRDRSEFLRKAVRIHLRHVGLSAKKGAQPCVDRKPQSNEISRLIEEIFTVDGEE